MITCQQQNILKIRDGIPGHGPQRMVMRLRGHNFDRVLLECGCTIPVSWLPNKEKPE